MSLAKNLRARAERYRRMLRSINDEQARRSLEDYAAELEREAAAIEENSQVLAGSRDGSERE